MIINVAIGKGHDQNKQAFPSITAFSQAAINKFFTRNNWEVYKKPNSVAIEVLKKFSIYNTKQRAMILSVFLAENAALNHSTLNKRIGKKVDRITIYRTLYLFLKKGLLHTVPSADGVIYYVLQLNKNLAKEHIHFICSKCKKLVCLPDIPMPEIKAPQKLKIKNVDVVMNGICEDCNKE